jgi:surface protein
MSKNPKRIFGGTKDTFSEKEDLVKAIKDYVRNPESVIEKYGQVADWDISLITNMDSLFKGVIKTKQVNELFSGISEWDVSNVDDMSRMFEGCSAFNADLSRWNVSNVELMTKLFDGCAAFNSDISEWDVSKVEGMTEMFDGCTVFNSDLSKWDVSNVMGMARMFFDCSSFSSDISGWDVSTVEDMSEMFYGCVVFNSDLGKWDVSIVVSMTEMFYNCASFDSDISKWDVSYVEFSHDIFHGCPLNNPENAAKRPKFGDEEADEEEEESADIVTYDTVPASPIKISSITSIPSAVMGTNYITLDEEGVLKYIREKRDNLVFIWNKKYYLSSREELKQSVLISSNIKYGCNKVYDRLHVSEDMYDGTAPYLVLRSIGFPGGVVSLGLIKTIMQDDSIQLIEIIKSSDTLVSTVSLQMLMPGASAVGASHCQEGQGDVVYTVKRIVLFKRNTSVSKKRVKVSSRGTRSLTKTKTKTNRTASRLKSSPSPRKTKKISQTL